MLNQPLLTNVWDVPVVLLLWKALPWTSWHYSFIYSSDYFLQTYLCNLKCMIREYEHLKFCILCPSLHDEVDTVMKLTPRMLPSETLSIFLIFKIDEPKIWCPIVALIIFPFLFVRSNTVSCLLPLAFSHFCAFLSWDFCLIYKNSV